VVKKAENNKTNQIGQLFCTVSVCRQNPNSTTRICCSLQQIHNRSV